MVLFKPTTTRGIFFIRCAEHLLLGAILGGVVELISKYMSKEYGKPLGMLFQSFSLIFVMYMVKYHLSINIGNQWQQMTEGILFVAMYFGLQSTLYSNINYYFSKIIII